MVVQYVATVHSVSINECDGIPRNSRFPANITIDEALALMLLTPSRHFIEAHMKD